MYLYSRRVTMSTNSPKAREWVAHITEKASQVTGWQLSLFTRVMSSDVGTMMWSAVLPDLGSVEAGGDKLAVDNGFIELQEQGAQYTIQGTLHDALSTILYPTELANDGRQINYGASVESTLASGHLADGIAIGVEIAERAQNITGVPTLFAIDNTGNYGGVRWLTGYADIQELERAEQALNSNADFATFIDTRAANAFTSHPGATVQAIFRRVT
jgi:hypothetical protein